MALIAVDYPNRSRLKIYGRARFDPDVDPADLGLAGRAEGVVTVAVVAFDWNCPKYITPRFTADQVEAALEPLHQRITDLEHQLAQAREAGR